MNRRLCFCATLILAGCVNQPAPAANEPLPEPATPALAREVSDVAARLEGCNHFGGEIGDNDPERTAQIESAMDELRCGDELDRDVARIRETYAANPAVEEALRAATEL
ncbi:MAG TPA: hypothetical protein VGB53_10850 [Rubricoccaceae bacterium]